jgi:hypothetical protein
LADGRAAVERDTLIAEIGDRAKRAEAIERRRQTTAQRVLVGENFVNGAVNFAYSLSYGEAGRLEAGPVGKRSLASRIKDGMEDGVVEGAQGGARFITRGAMIGAASAALVTFTPLGEEIEQLRPAIAQAAEELAALQGGGAGASSPAEPRSLAAVRGTGTPNDPVKPEIDAGQAPSAKPIPKSGAKPE